MEGTLQNTSEPAEAPPASTVATAMKISVEVAAVTRKAIHPASVRFRAVSNVSAAPATQMRMEANTACSGVIMIVLLR